MGIEVNVTREFIVNGKQYRSLEEVPAEYRRAIQGTPGSPLGNSHTGTCSEIVVNGKRYRGEDAMPDGVREIYDAAMQCVRAGKPPAFPNPPLMKGSATPSGRWLMLGGLLFCLLASLLLLLLPR